jgi:hypothetical protein
MNRTPIKIEQLHINYDPFPEYDNIMFCDIAGWTKQLRLVERLSLTVHTHLTLGNREFHLSAEGEMIKAANASLGIPGKLSRVPSDDSPDEWFWQAEAGKVLW